MSAPSNPARPWGDAAAKGQRALERLGRYVVLSQLGAGTMGVVYVAYDPTLDRKVAVKVLHGRQRGADVEQARLRLVREARSMARLSHPHVVQVYDAGLVDGPSGDEVFLAMELVEGTDLSSWLKARPGRRGDAALAGDVLQAFLQAGRGLAAAHDAGLVHRDFKPGNVLITEDGTVKVTDFGLARSPTDAPPPPPSGDLPEATDLDLTATGDMLGTPAYMAPEQHEGRGVGPASDQFSFCLALYEALYEQPAFEGDSWAARALSVVEGRSVPPPPDAVAPAEVAKVLQRGLDRDPAARFSDMRTLVLALEATVRPPRAQARLWWASVVAAVVVIGLALFATGSGPCGDAGRGLETVWNPDVGAALEQAWSRTELPYAAKTYGQVRQTLDSYAARWADARRAACEATKVERVQSDALLDRRIACLEERRDELQAFVGELLRPDASLVRSALGAAEGLSEVAVCGDLSRLAVGGRAPSEGLVRLRAQLAQARGQSRAGRYAESLRTVQTASAAWAEVHDPVGSSELALAWGRAEASVAEHREAARWLRRAFLLAVRARHPPVAGASAAALVPVVGVALAEHDEGLLWADIAQAALQQFGPRPAARGSVEGQRARVLSAKGDRRAAVTAARSALALLEQSRVGPFEAAQARVALASTLIDIRDFKGALVPIEAAVTALEARLGESHPALIEPLTLHARALQGVLRFDDAEAQVLRAVRLARVLLGPEHALLGEALVRQGSLYTRLNRHAPAIAAYEEAIAVLTRAYGPEHTLVGRAWLNLGVTYHRMGELERAAEHYAKVLAIREARLGPEHPDLAVILQNLGSMKVESGRAKAAIPELRRALSIRTRHLASKIAVADVQFWLGRALFESGEDRKQGLELVRTAHATFVAEKANPVHHTRSWLESKGLLR